MTTVTAPEPVQKEDLKPVLKAAQSVARQMFFQTNEFISKRLVPGQYHLYADLAAFTAADVRMALDDGTKASVVTNRLGELVKSGALIKRSAGQHNLYWFADTAFLNR
jgi:hypothetical protein